MNTLTLLRLPNFVRRGHGGDSTCRAYVLYANGILVESFRENAAPHYNTGHYLDSQISDEVNKLQEILKCKVVKVRSKS